MTAAPWHDVGLRTVTPAFLGRFDTFSPEPARMPFPVPTLRGVLAYWLRALAGAHIGNRTGVLHDVESAVFGAARQRDSGGPSAILLRAGTVLVQEYIPRPGDHGVRYLLGPGLTNVKEPPARCLLPGPLVLRVKNAGTPAHADLFLAALWGLRTFGGIGARTRRGVGTIAIDDVPSLGGNFDRAWLTRDTVSDLDPVLSCVKTAMSELSLTLSGGPAAGETPRYPCFAPGRYQLSADDEDELTRATNPTAALDLAGTWLRDFRHGANRRLAGSGPAHHSQTYTNVAQPFLDHHPQTGPLTAGALGLPIPYSDHQGPPRQDDPARHAQRTAMVDVMISGKPARRASPLWLRVRQDGPGWRLRSLAFHAEWLPSDAKLRITAGHRTEPVAIRPTDDEIQAELTRWFVP